MARRSTPAGRSACSSRRRGHRRPRLPAKFGRKAYEKERRCNLELVKLQQCIKQTGQGLVLVFEGRNGAGKGGAIKRILEPLNPRGDGATRCCAGFRRL